MAKPLEKRFEPGSEELRVFETDWKHGTVTEADREFTMRYATARGGDMPYRAAAGKFKVSGEYEAWRVKVLNTPLP